MKKIVSALVLCVFGAAFASPLIRHAKVSTKPASSDPSVISGPDWNADHVIDLNALSAALGITGTRRSLFIVRTDSNGMGPPTETDQDDPADNVTVPNANIVYTKIYTNNFAEPVTPVNMGTGSLRIQGFNPAHGPELTLGKSLDELLNGPGATPDSSHKVWIDQMSIHSTLLRDWMQGSTAGTSSPLLGGGNLDADSNARSLTAVAASSREAACEFVMLGTNDASDTTAASNVLTNIPAYETRQRSVLGSQLLFVWVVPQTTIPNPPYVFKATARANAITALQAATGTAAVFAEDIPTSDDLTHFVSIGQQVLGTRMAFAYTRLAGLRERVVSAPGVVGVSQGTYNGSAHGLTGITGSPGTDLRAFPWQGSADGDVMFMPVFAGSIGAGSAIPTPSGWALGATQISSLDGAGVGNHVALFTKSLAQSELDGNNGFPLSPTVTPGGAQFVTKSFTVRGSGRFPVFDGAATAFTHTTVDTSAVTAPGVTTSKAGRTVFVMVFGWSGIGQSFTVTNAGLTGFTQVFGAAYPSSSGNYLYVGLWSGTKDVAGATGNSTVQPVLAASSQGYTWAM